jgi:uncharacterized protein (TIGR03083 family)
VLDGLIFHIARSSDWREAQRSGEYRRSTRDATLDEVGFIHCSFAGQVDRVLRLIYADDDADLVVLTIDPSQVPAEVRPENLDGGAEVFPHIYGPLPVGAVVEAVPVAVDRHRRVCGAFAAEAVRYADTVAGADPSTPVDTCPGWTLDDLTRHVGSVHRWAGQMVRDLAQRRLSWRHVELGLDGDARPDADWIRAGTDEVLVWLLAADPDLPMWAWGADQHVRFWARRLLHETAVHRADVELARGREPAIAAGTAVDGIDEFLDNLPSAADFAPRVVELTGTGTIGWRTTDTGDHWRIRLDPDGYAWDHEPGDAADVTVSALASDLVLMVYGRRRPHDADRFRVDGDAGLLDWWLERASI